jgi:purine-binding chemotaxis protein CheW
MMNQLLLIAIVGGQRVALRACEVQSVIELEGLTPVPRAPAHVAGLSALRSRVLTVIDCRASLGLPGSEARRAAAVVEHQGHFYALLVDRVEDVVEVRSEPAPVRAGLGPGWERVSLGMVEAGDEALLLIDVAAMIGGPDEARAA